MEIEAKFTIPNTDRLERLRAMDHVAEFALAAGRVQSVSDTYLDTAEYRILAAGYFLRGREQDGGVLITLKQLAESDGAIHRREEVQVLLPAYEPPRSWPIGPVRDQVLRWIGEAPLIPLFTLSQTRTIRPVTRLDKTIAELSLDEVRLVGRNEEQTFFELEVELAEGSEGDLTAIVSSLEGEWGLQPQWHSKFQRALALLGVQGAAAAPAQPAVRSPEGVLGRQRAQRPPL